MSITTRDCLIIALDGLAAEKALDIAKRLSGRVWGFKTNDLLIERGTRIISELREYGKVFADAKSYDIPNTVKNTVKRLNDAGADLITVHASGGPNMIRAAVEAAPNAGILAVTVLTSFSPEECRLLFGKPPGDAVPALARFAATAGAYGVVCSPEELELLSHDPSLSSLKRITPGVRPTWYGKADDQSRVASPAEAILRGASFLVMGRPVVEHADVTEAVELIGKELG